jgi:hypothetical protein
MLRDLFARVTTSRRAALELDAHARSDVVDRARASPKEAAAERGAHERFAAAERAGTLLLPHGASLARAVVRGVKNVQPTDARAHHLGVGREHDGYTAPVRP